MPKTKKKLIKEPTQEIEFIYSFKKSKCPTCGRIMKCKGSGGKKKNICIITVRNAI